MKRLAYPLFNCLLLLAAPLIGLGVLLRWRKRVFSNEDDRWAERWGVLSTETSALLRQGTWWWVHAVSVGEVKAIEPFLRQIPQATNVKVLLSVVTPEALAWAEQSGLSDRVIAAPLDFPWIVQRVVRAVKPAVFISVESEFWPNLLRAAKRSGARVALINGRISARSFRSYARIRFVLGALWETVDLFAVRQQEDADRFKALGVPPEKIHVTGNLKYDLLTDPGEDIASNGHSPIVVMGSTREGEESRLLPALERVRANVPELRVIWAPRHIERMAELETLLKSHGLSYQRISDVRKALPGSVTSTPNILWDSMGDLLEAYRQADVAVMGGSFVPRGQNPIEPAAMRVPVLFGPSMDNFRAVAESLVKAGGADRVTLDELEGRLSALLNNPEARQLMGERGHQAVLAEQGASQRTLQLLLKP